MPQTTSSIFNTIRNFFKSKIVLGVIILVVLGVGAHFLFHKSPVYQFVPVKQGSITESVSLTGNTAPKQSVSLAFASSGIVSHIYSSLGANVQAGQLLAELDTSNLEAQLQSAQAGLTIAEQNANSSQNNLANVTAEQNAIVASARQAVYSNFAAVSSGTFTSDIAPIISGSYTGTTDGSYVVTVYSSNFSTGASFSYTGLESGNGNVTANTAVPLGTEGLFVNFPGVTSNGNNYVGTTWTIDVPNTRSDGYAAALKNYQTALETRDTTIANAQASVGTDNSSSVSNAQIAEAQASVDGITAQIANAKIVAPISGTVTQFDAKVGQLASETTPLISIISSGGYEVDAGVSEIDVGKVIVGDTVSMTLDAFPNETFTGTVFYIAPAETNTDGVISYQVKIAFDKVDSRLKSGLTANIDIQTKHEDNVLILPQYAILQNDQGTFVETLVDNKIVQNPVTLGIADENGNVEIVSGVTLGEQVLNIGLKT